MWMVGVLGFWFGFIAGIWWVFDFGLEIGGWIWDFYEKIRMFGLFRQTFALNLLAGY